MYATLLTTHKAAYTEPVYQTNAALIELKTRVLSCRVVSSLDENEKALAKRIPQTDYAVITEKTVFYAQGGGQPSDTGVMQFSDVTDNDFLVSLVRNGDGGKILHFGRFQRPDVGSLLADSQIAIQHINIQTRLLHSQLHSAGHVIGLAMKLLVPILGEMKKVKANHIPGEASMEFQGLLFNEHKPVIEGKINELIQKSLDIKIHWWNSQQMKQQSLSPKHVPNADGLYRVMEITGLDFNPCGGTHVPRTSDCGSITIRKISRQKGISRLSYEVAGLPLPDFWTTSEY